MRTTTNLSYMLVTLAAILLPRQATATVDVWVAGSTEKIQDRNRSPLPHDRIWDAATRTASLDGVRGERVPFHVVITVEEENRHGITLQASDFRDGDNVLAADQIQFFYEHLTKIYAPSGRHGKRGYWPDALVPLTQPLRINAAPLHFGLRKRNQPIWVEVTVPVGQQPGNYEGTITVSSDDGELGKVNVKLTVWDIALPEDRKFPVNIGLWEDHIAQMHDVDRDSAEFREIFHQYVAFFLDQGFDPRTNPGLLGEMKDGKYVLECQQPELEKLFLDGGRQQFMICPKPMGVPVSHDENGFSEDYKGYVREHCRQVIVRAKEHGWYDKLHFHMPIDEPKSAQAYETLRHWAAAVRPVDPSVPISLTEQPAPENPAWGSLVGHIDAWIINGNYVYMDPGSIVERKQAGDHVTWYISCDQLYPQPNMFIDREAADMRMVSWITARYGMDGFLYWTATYWREVKDPWVDAVSWKCSPCNTPAAGEGSLIYPGHLVYKYTRQGNVDGPVGSLRLAMLREGFEELELVQILRDLGGEEVADEIIGDICRDLRDFSRDPNAIDAARDRIIQEILKRQ